MCVVLISVRVLSLCLFNSQVSTTTGKFVPFESKTSELESGILHLFRDKLSEEDGSASSSSHSPREVENKSLVLACLAVPAYVSTQDWIEFMEPVLQVIAHIRIIRDSFPNRYMVVLKFREQEDADLV